MVRSCRSSCNLDLESVGTEVALGRSSSYHHFHQFHPVAEGVENISPMEAFKGLAIFAGKSCISQPDRKSLQIVHHKGRMCLRGGSKNRSEYRDTLARHHPQTKSRHVERAPRVSAPRSCPSLGRRTSEQCLLPQLASPAIRVRDPLHCAIRTKPLTAKIT